jgi:flavodoxin
MKIVIVYDSLYGNTQKIVVEVDRAREWAKGLIK